MRKDSRLFKLAERLTAEQLAVVIALIDGRAAYLGKLAVRPCAAGWTVHGFDDDAEEHTVLADLSACTCQDNRYRGRECKHLKALKRWLRGPALPGTEG